MTDHRRSVARVLRNDGVCVGTAFFCLPKGFVVTCSHVLDLLEHAGPVQLEIITPGGGRPQTLFAARCPQWSRPSKDDDISVLRVDAELPDAVVPLAFSARAPGPGDVADAYGFPVHNKGRGMPGSGPFEGWTSHNTTGHDLYVVHSNLIARGFSGGPCVLRSTGEVVGVVTELTSPDLQKRWADGAFITPMATVLSICPEIVVGVPDVVLTLTKTWVEQRATFHNSLLPGGHDAEATTAADQPLLERMTILGAATVPIGAALNVELTAKVPKMICIVGAPGSGKSYLLAMLASESWRAPDAFGLSEKLVPILVTASSFALPGAKSVSDRLFKALGNDGKISSSEPMMAASVEDLICSGRFRCLILIDAPDEIASDIERNKFVDLLFANADSLLAQKHLVVVTSRPLIELSRPSLKEKYVAYRLPQLDEAASKKLLQNHLGPRYHAFNQLAQSTGLAPYLDTPLLTQLAARLYLMNQTAFPNDITALYGHFLAQVSDKWPHGPVPKQSLISALSYVALHSIESDRDADHYSHWLTEPDKVLRSVLAHLQETIPSGTTQSLHLPQAIVNFAFQHSDLLFRQGNAVQWRHLLLRDYLISLHLEQMGRTDPDRVGEILSFNFARPAWTEAAILFIVAQSKARRAEQWLDAISPIGRPMLSSVVRFIKRAIMRGATLDAPYLDRYFDAFYECAMAEQYDAGTCPELFADDYAMFWHLLCLQRIPQARAAIEKCVRKASTDSLLSQWPVSDTARAYTPAILYQGPLATLAPLFPRSLAPEPADVK
jgi:hypothetical protein